MFRIVRPGSLNDVAAHARQAFEVPVLLAALAVIPVMVIDERWASDGWQALAAFANWATWAVFAVAARFVVEDEEEVMEETHEIRERMDSVQEQLDRIGEQAVPSGT